MQWQGPRRARRAPSTLPRGRAPRRAARGARSWLEKLRGDVRGIDDAEVPPVGSHRAGIGEARVAVLGDDPHAQRNAAAAQLRDEVTALRIPREEDADAAR